MSDLVQRLRDVVALRAKSTPLSDFIPMCQQAADELDRLTRELEEAKQKLRTAALESMARNADDLGLDY